jgi:hypothetical protein
MPRATIPADMLRRLGVLRPDGHLTQAGALLFCPADRTYLSLSVIDVEGGDVVLKPSDLSGFSVLEQLAAVETRLDSVNTEVTIRGGFAESTVRRLPPAAVREAVLNGLVHRDWMLADPIKITWVQADSAMQVISPGAFIGGITAETVLTQRFARHPALADLFRALDLVDKQGLGVDRMYREMVVLGHRPPVIVEEDGPRVRVRPGRRPTRHPGGGAVHAAARRSCGSTWVVRQCGDLLDSLRALPALERLARSLGALADRLIASRKGRMNVQAQQPEVRRGEVAANECSPRGADCRSAKSTRSSCPLRAQER